VPVDYISSRMMKKLIVIAWIIAFKISAQVNLVMNPSFEEFTICPDGQNQINKAKYWDSCRSSPDYFNACSTSPEVRLPTNDCGHQIPANGNAFSGICTYNSGTQNYREYIVGTLSSSLQVGQKYFVSIKVNRADSNILMGYSTNKLGCRFSKIKLTNVPITNTSNVVWNNIITDTVAWTQMFSSFISDSTYKFILLGNFFDDSNINKINHGNGTLAYYFIDEICVSLDSAYTANYITNVISNNLDYEASIKIYLDCISREIVITGNRTGEIVSIYDSSGIIWFNDKTTSSHIKIPYERFHSGLYVVKIGTIRKKILIGNY
jgi:hypothetical protein